MNENFSEDSFRQSKSSRRHRVPEARHLLDSAPRDIGGGLDSVTRQCRFSAWADIFDLGVVYEEVAEEFLKLLLLALGLQLLKAICALGWKLIPTSMKRVQLPAFVRKRMMEALRGATEVVELRKS